MSEPHSSGLLAHHGMAVVIVRRPRPGLGLGREVDACHGVARLCRKLGPRGRGSGGHLRSGMFRFGSDRRQWFRPRHWLGQRLFDIACGCEALIEHPGRSFAKPSSVSVRQQENSPTVPLFDEKSKRSYAQQSPCLPMKLLDVVVDDHRRHGIITSLCRMTSRLPQTVCGSAMSAGAHSV
jgi:hypothetical protein